MVVEDAMIVVVVEVAGAEVQLGAVQENGPAYQKQPNDDDCAFAVSKWKVKGKLNLSGKFHSSQKGRANHDLVATAAITVPTRTPVRID
jgi:hypothetical protein